VLLVPASLSVGGAAGVDPPPHAASRAVSVRSAVSLILYFYY
jgi:hypothetical protein